MLQEAALPFNAPGLIHGGRDRAENAERTPDEGQRANDPDLHTRLAEGIELCVDEFELRREVAEDKRQHREAVAFVRRDRSQEGNHQEQKGEQGQ